MFTYYSAKVQLKMTLLRPHFFIKDEESTSNDGNSFIQQIK